MKSNTELSGTYNLYARKVQKLSPVAKYDIKKLSLTANSNKGEQGESQRRGDGMHSTGTSTALFNLAPRCHGK